MVLAGVPAVAGAPAAYFMQRSVMAVVRIMPSYSFRWGGVAFAWAGVEVIVDEASGLQKRVADNGAEKPETSLAHVGTYCIGYF